MRIEEKRMNKNWKLFKIVCFLFTIFLFSQVTYPRVQAYTLMKPFEPQIIEAGEIRLGQYNNPDSKEYHCYLREGHKYHIFLVGDWVTNNTAEATDYDIEVRNPSTVVISTYTMSAGIPEQVANDEKHQYFVPSQTGDYRFKIYNDPKDSQGEDAAVFMIIEHLEMNTRYSKELIGKPNIGAEYPEGYKIGYEFNTSESEFLLHIEVPDPVPVEGIRGLDMYEARVFPMGNPSANIGYTIQEIELSKGELLHGDLLDTRGEAVAKENVLEESSYGEVYGGYNLDISGFSFPDMKISCETAGVDMIKKMRAPTGNSTDNVFYYLALLAEYFEGEIEFYLKTDYSPVNLTLINPPEVGYTNYTTLIKVESESTSEIRNMWIEYTRDNWKNVEEIELIDKDDYWLAALPLFDLHDEVKYRIHARDEIDNTGLIEGSFTVMNQVEIDFGVSGSVIQGGQTVKITGAATRPSINLKLNIEHGGTTNSINVQTDGDGVFTYDYLPTKIGEYDITLSYSGDEDYHSAISREKSFRVDKRKLELTTEIDTQPVKVERPMTITGKITPAVNGMEVEFIFVNPETSFTETVTTNREGMFSLTITPEVVGSWDMLPQLMVSELFDASQGSLNSFEVQKLTPIDIVAYQAMKFTEPPLLYVLIGVGVILVVVLQKTGALDRIRGLSDEDYDDEEEEEEPEQKNGGATAYKRRSAR